MIKIFFATAILVAGLSMSSNVYAATAEELAAQIAALQNQLASLQETTSGGSGELAGTVEDPVKLNIDNIDPIKTYAISNGSFEDGWSWIFNVTVPENETILRMKFADWANGVSKIAGTNNIRFYSAQSTNAGNSKTAIMITAANEYSSVMNIGNYDLDATKAGRQIQITVDAKVPSGSVGGAYTTSYGINTEADPNQANKEGEIVLHATPGSTNTNIILYESDQEKQIMSFNVEAVGSDINLQSIKIKFDKLPSPYFSSIRLYDDFGTEIAQTEINSDSILVNGVNNYWVTLDNFVEPFVVANNESRALVVKIDVKDNISQSLTGETGAIISLGLASDTAVTGIDEAGLFEYAGDIAIFNTVQVKQVTDLVDTFLTIQANDDTPNARNVVAGNGVIEGATLLTFDLEIDGNDATIYEINSVAIEKSDTNYPDKLYLYDDSNTLLGLSDIDSNGFANFTDLYFPIYSGNTSTFTIKVDYDTNQANAIAGETFVAVVNGDSILAKRVDGMVLNADELFGEAVSEPVYCYSSGPQFTISNIDTAVADYGDSAEATSTISTLFTVTVKALGGDIYLPKTATDAFVIYSGLEGNEEALVTSATQTVSGATTETNTYKVSENKTATFKVKGTYEITASGNWDLRMNSIKWDTDDDATPDYTSNYMSNVGGTADDYEASWISDVEYLQP